ncbi:hypothetical protein E3N88_40957 [Mikania micrantha]|uniref:Protein kinase domain-containing protein n=1 Tax=Mikania micrantha TaxID=192012 RepID=A0A5N6LP13_9ASTR|nr:hypothetical protein E3N88_40957 [Mikania micrantha]
MSVPNVTESSSSESPQLCRQFTFSEIQLASQNLDESLVIGHGGFGKVYKGTIANGSNRLIVAIKRLDSTSDQGASEFWAEVNMLSNLRHCHLVSLIGYCNDGQEMILVYEYMSHGTLEDRLHNCQIPLSWMQRLTICIGAARGLDYLHTGTGIKNGLVHRDVKSSNILLHGSWAAKISDFGLSKICPKNQQSTYVNTIVKGTFGYLDPDYFYTGKLTRKSDVYALGVVLFEVLCGKRAVDRSIDEEQWALAIWAQDSIKEGRLKQIVDTSIRGSVSTKYVKMFSQLAKRCLHKHLKQRPTMAEVVVCLESILALQEKANSTSQLTIVQKFGRFTPMFIYPSNVESVENSGGSSVNSLELYFDTVGGENQTLHHFDIDTLIVATQNFSEANRIAPYSCGRYKGKLQNGQSIAVAPTSSGTTCEVYMNEASILAKLEHENVAKLLGYCIEGKIWFLVYEFTVLESLDRLICLAVNETDCHVSRIFAGCGGYLAPEYVLYGDLSTKVDVFNLGVLILQIIIGHKGTTIDFSPEEGLLKFVEGNWLNVTLSNIIDPMIDVDLNSLTSFVEIGLLCVQEDAADRPTMEEVVSMLLDRLSLALPVAKMRQMITTTRECGSSVNSLELYFDTVRGENQTLHRFDIDTLIVATQNFSEANRIAPYSCGRYKVTIGKLQNGQSIAVAPTSSGTTCEVYMNEASILAKLEHENVAKLLGYCIEGKIWFLVYEFTMLESLDRLMFGSRSILLNWDKRYKIILGVARALLYLHKDAPVRVIHSDVNPRNIFLDESLNAKLSNFWNARCLAINETDCHVSRIFAACGGYLAPEYVLYGDLSTKADVFNLGVLILQIIIGQRGTTIDISPEEGLLKFVEGNWLNGTLSNIIDPMIDVDLNSLTSFVEIGLLCVQEDASDRPTMEEVVFMLVDRSSLAHLVAKMREMITTTREPSNGISSDVDDNDSHDGYYTCVDEDDFLFELVP